MLSESTLCCRARCGSTHATYCVRCDLLVDLGDLHVTIVDVDAAVGLLMVGVESARSPMGCPECGMIAHSHGRSNVTLVDAPCFDRPVPIVWRKRTWRCDERSCAKKVFTEQNPVAAVPRAGLTMRACWWAIKQLHREHASVAGLARQLRTTWNTLWSSIKPMLQVMADDETRFAGVRQLGVAEHLWHHVSELPIDRGGRGPKQLTGMVDLTPAPDGTPRGRLLDLVPGRSGKAYSDWLTERGDGFTGRVKVATLDPFHGYKNAIDDQLDNPTAVLDAFHVVKLGTQAVDEVRRRVQQAIHGHRDRKNDPLYRIATSCAQPTATSPNANKPASTPSGLPTTRHIEVYVAWQYAQQLRSPYHAPSMAEGERIAEKVLASFPTCPTPEIKRPGPTLHARCDDILAWFDHPGSSNSGTEAVNGLIELQQRIARRFRNRDHYQLRMLLIGG